MSETVKSELDVETTKAKMEPRSDITNLEVSAEDEIEDTTQKVEKEKVDDVEKVGTSFHNSSSSANGGGDPSKLGFSIAQIMGFMGSTKVKRVMTLRVFELR